MLIKPRPDREFNLVLLSGEGLERTLIPFQEGWGFFEWMDEEQLAFEHDPTSIHISTDILEVATGRIRTLATDLPGYWLPDYWVFGRWDVVRDGSLALAAYIRGEVPEQSFVLRSTSRGDDLWSFKSGNAAYTRPVWSPDGSRLAVATMNEPEDNNDGLQVFIVDQTGGAVKWLDIPGYYPNALHLVMKWSPDGRYLAFSPKASTDRPLLILDTVAHELLDLCVPTNAWFGDILWSADSSRIIVPRWHASAMVLDLGKQITGEIVTDYQYRPLAWLSQSP